jgi:RNA polymerase primary sigma factor
MKPLTTTQGAVTSTTVVRSRHPVSVFHYAKGALKLPAPAPAGRNGTATLPAPPPSVSRRRPGPVESGDGDMVFRLYAREIGQVPLLSTEEEASLSKRTRAGDAAAREQMIKANLRLVVKIAHDFEGYGMPLLDLISEGNLGLMKAVERYDPAKGAKLSTYAAFYIKQAMRRSIADHARLIRLPVYAQEKLLLISRAESRLRELLGRTPTDEEISDEVHLPPAKVRRLRAAALPPTSLDASQEEDGTNPVSEAVADESARAPDEELRQDDMANLMIELMQHLPPRELRIIRHRFGFEEGREKTLEEIGQEMGLTRERIRQLQNSALRRLRTRLQTRDAIRLAA